MSRRAPRDSPAAEPSSSRLPAQTRVEQVAQTVAEKVDPEHAGEIYGKVLESVVGAPGSARVWFTSISPELRTWLSALG